MSVGTRLRSLRLEHNVNTKEMMQRFGVTKFTLSRWENDVYVPTKETLIKLAAFYGVSVDWILQGIPTAENPLEKRLNISNSSSVAAAQESEERKHLTTLFGALSQNRQGRLLGYLDALCGEELFERQTG